MKYQYLMLMQFHPNKFVPHLQHIQFFDKEQLIQLMHFFHFVQKQWILLQEFVMVMHLVHKDFGNQKYLDLDLELLMEILMDLKNLMEKVFYFLMHLEFLKKIH
mmetsp:Transcript_21/g.59  ORF Transcript_21/g.59 Transcript_21/m.59 type:complete len:104 (-) Transcript_21:1787-2098(-)